MVNRIIRVLGLNEGEVRRRLDFLNLTKEDINLLRKLGRSLSEDEIRKVVDRFYDHILSFEEVREKFAGEDQIEKVKREQTSYLLKLIEGKLNMDYVRRSVEVGLRHEEAGVEPKQFTGAFAVWVDLVSDLIEEKVPKEDVPRTLVALFKAVILNITLTLDAYYYVKIVKSGDVRYRTALEAVPDGILVFDTDTKLIVDANAQAKALIGDGDLEGKQISSIFPEEIREDLSGRIEGGTFGDRSAYVENRASGEWIPVELSLGTFRSEGREFGVLVIRDIREKVLSEEKLRKLGKLYEALSGINTLVTTVDSVERMFSEAVKILKEKGDFKYAGVFDRESGDPVAEEGEFSERDTSVCIAMDPVNGESYFMVISKHGKETMSVEEVQLIKEIAHDLSFGLRKILSERLMRHMEIHDNLTGLPDRTHFIQKLKEVVDQAGSRKAEVALLVIDIDHFNDLNQALGHEAGDRILREVAARLKGIVRRSDFLARIGGDEFAVVVISEDAKTAVRKLIERIGAAFSEPIRVDSRDVYLTFSQGVSFFPEDTDLPEVLLANAMASVSRSKHLGGNRTVYFSEGVERVTEEKIRIRTDLRKAFDRGEFTLYYQPKVDLRTGRIVGCEALIRWVRDGEVIPPSKFLPVIEESELIHSVGEWVVGEVCRQINDWKRKGIDISVAVNVSPIQLRSPSFADSFVATVSRCSDNFENLEVEITESAIMEDVNASVEFLNTLASCGIRTYIDDFGTGYSSLFYLKKLPVYALKIDREFIKDLPEDRDDLEIVKAIILLARTFGLKTVAEGTETEAQVNLLKDLGCDFAQGYYFSPPVPADEFERLIRENS